MNNEHERVRVMLDSVQGEELRKRIHDAYVAENRELDRIGDAFGMACDDFGNQLNRKERRKLLSSKRDRRRPS